MKKPQTKIKRSHYILYIVPILFILTLIFINHPNTSALTYQNDNDLLFTINPSITLSVSGDLSINDLAPNTASDSNIITITAGSNSTLGYTLYTNVGDSTNAWTDLKLNGTDNTNKFSVLSSAVSTLDAIGASKWGYSYCDATSSPTNCDNTNNWVYGSAGSTATGYGIMPQYNSTTHANDIKLADANSSSETTINFKIGAKAADTQAAGTYTNVINFINIPKITTIDYSLTYTDNSSTTTSGTMPSPNPQTGTTTDGTFRLSTTKPTNTNSNLVFKAWCTANNSSDVTSCPGSTIYPGNLYVIGSSSSSFTTSVYAVWQDNTPVPTKLYMQNIADWKDTVLPNIGDETIAYDARDEKAYYIAKLPDGNIWMTQNLDHDINSSYNYNSTNTDVPANWSDTLTSTYATGTTTWISLYTVPESYDPGDRCWNGTLDPGWSTKLDTGTTACSSITTTPDHYHIGNYYNWTASVAMQNSSSYTADNTDVNQSICPAGWMLPKSGTVQTGSGSFYDLVNGRYTAGTSGNIQSSPVYFVYGGSWSKSPGLVSSYGYYWSSVVRASNYSYNLIFNVADSLINPQSYGHRGVGDLVRCLAR